MPPHTRNSAPQAREQAPFMSSVISPRGEFAWKRPRSLPPAAACTCRAPQRTGIVGARRSFGSGGRHERAWQRSNTCRSLARPRRWPGRLRTARRRGVDLRLVRASSWSGSLDVRQSRGYDRCGPASVPPATRRGRPGGRFVPGTRNRLSETTCRLLQSQS